jgi:hypothetical protein
MAAKQTLGQIRPFTEEDIPQVTDLHMRVTGNPDDISPGHLNSCRTYLAEVFLDNPWRDEAISSLVHQEGDGRITGFIGVLPQRMSINGNVVRAALLCEFVVDFSARGFTGVNLLSKALRGPQDLSYSDQANASSRNLFEGLGGATSFLYSTRWTYPLRLFQFARYFLKKQGLLPPLLLPVSSSVARILDTLGAPLRNRPSLPSAPRLLGEDLTCETLLACLTEFTAGRFLRPDYDHRSLSWLLERADRKRRKRRLQKVLVKTEQQEIAGWYLYYSEPRRPAEVLQLFAKPRFARGVVEHLFYHAWQQGAIAVSGRLEPDVAQVVSDKHCLCNLGPNWMVVHSRRPELLSAFDRGNVRLSRLDGEPASPFPWPSSAGDPPVAVSKARQNTAVST